MPLTNVSTAHPPEFPLEIPRDLRWLTPRYEFVRELGRGMSTVYLARTRDGVDAPGADEPGGEVAIKVIGSANTGDRETAERFAREARTAIALVHPNIVRTLAIETEGDAVAIVSEYVAGQTLRAALHDHPAFSFDRAASVLRDVASALATAHAARIVHRDVKPENIFLETGTGRALLGDFGIARSIDADALLTQDGASLGTPAYMAPEQVDGLPVDERTDVYALGLIGWEMLAGRRPWQGESLYVLLQKQRTEALPDLAGLRPDVPLFLHRAIEGALAKDPGARWPDAQAVLQQLSPAPIELPALPDTVASATTGDSDGISNGATLRFSSGELAAVRPDSGQSAARGPVAELAISPEQYARDAFAVEHLPPRRPRRGRWAIGAGLAAALAAAAFAGTRYALSPGSGDAQLDSLLAMTARSDTAIGSTSARTSVAPSPSPAAESAQARARDSLRLDAPPPVPPAAPEPTSPAATPIAAESASVAPAGGTRTVSVPDSAASTTATGEVTTPRSTTSELCRSTTNADQRRCLLAIAARNDAALTRNYEALIRNLRQRSGGALEPPSVRALRAEQRGWVDARDRICARGAPTTRAHWGLARAPCFSGFSARRAAVLSARLRGLLPMAR